MEIEYEKVSCNKIHIERDPIHWWIQFNLGRGGIEDKMQKMVDLLAILGEKFLVDNPRLVDSVASAIGCEGSRHVIPYTGNSDNES